MAFAASFAAKRASTIRVSSLTSFLTRLSLSTQAATASKGDQVVTFLTLNKLSDNPGAVKKKRRKGRGVGSGRGKTCGRGHNGQKSRSGGSIPLYFEGGQTNFFKAIPKRGFTNIHATPMVPVNIGQVQDYIDMGRLNPNQPITIKELVDSGMLKTSSVKHGVKLLAKGRERLTSALDIHVSRASQGAIEAIESVENGQVTTVHYNRLALRALLKPEKFDGPLPRQARPPPKWMNYYTNYKNRGYLSPQVQMRKLKIQLPPQQVQQAAGTIESTDKQEQQAAGTNDSTDKQVQQVAETKESIDK